MQTFLPYPDFDKSARVLDPSRLGNQAYREGKTLLNGGWKNHPASKMWRGYEYALCLYILACFEELTFRGRHYPHHIDEVTNVMYQHNKKDMPPWLGREDIHSSHRANLLRKDPVWYGKFGWTESPREGYVWPI